MNHSEENIIRSFAAVKADIAQLREAYEQLSRKCERLAADVVKNKLSDVKLAQKVKEIKVKAKKR